MLVLALFACQEPDVVQPGPAPAQPADPAAPAPKELVHKERIFTFNRLEWDDAFLDNPGPTAVDSALIDADKAYVSTREELKGDLLVQLKRTDEARAAYEKAKQSLPEDGAGDALQIKLDDLSKGEA